MPAPISSLQDPAAVLATISYLVAALGLSAVAGLRAYLPLLAVGLASTLPGPSGGTLLHLQPNFGAVGSAPVLVLLVILMVVEFVVDKLPLIDHLSDAVHTVIRPAVGAIIMAGTQNLVSDHSQVLAAVIGAALAFGVHVLKASARPAVTATTAGIGNPVVSLVEDIIAVVGVLLLVFAPIIGFVALALFLFVLVRVLRGLFRRLFGTRQVPPPPPVPVPVPTPVGGGTQTLPQVSYGLPGADQPTMPATNPDAVYIPPAPPSGPLSPDWPGPIPPLWPTNPNAGDTATLPGISGPTWPRNP